MDKYHIYEEIGKGEFSIVYKGREKKQIEYVAIKRIEKSMMAKIVSEVQVLHKLESPHILKFHDWYETRSGLWLILEYCTGGDLETLLRQDEHLPESSVQIFGLDILAGLKYLHSLGILYCDLRPKNFLFDEHGIIKLSDFKLARNISNCLVGSAPLESRGHLPYLAPELFAADGIFSFATDFWALGCLLHELRRGFAPFGGVATDTSVLADRISTTDPIHHPVVDNAPSITACFSDLLKSLIEKSPGCRADWTELSTHDFWGNNINTAPISLPAQPQFEKFLKSIEDDRITRLESEVFVLEGVDPLTMKAVLSATPQKFLGVSVEQSESSSREKIRNIEQEFSPITRIAPVASESTYKDKRASKLKSANPDEIAGGSNRSVAGNFQSSIASSAATTVVATIPNEELHTSLHSSAIEGDKLSSHIQKDDRSLFDANGLIVHPSDLQVKPIVGNKAIEIIDVPPFKASGLPCKPLSLEEVAKLSQSDLEAHLTVLYKSLLKATSSQQPNTSSSSSMSGEKSSILAYLCGLSPSAEVSNVVLNTHFLPLILRLARSSTPQGSASRLSTRPTSQSGTPTPASSTSSSATVLANPAMQTRLLAITVLAMMIRFATFILPPTNEKDDHIISTLSAVLKETPKLDVKIRRRALAALGEVVFYISAQGQEPGERDEDPWRLPVAALSLVLKCLRDDPDETMKHYAAKLVENCMAQGGLEFKRRLLLSENAEKLADLAINGRSDAIQLTSASALFHLLAHAASISESRVSPTAAGGASTNLSGSPIPSGPRFVARIVEKGEFLKFTCDVLREGNPKLQLVHLNILNLILCDECYTSTSVSVCKSVLMPIRNTIYKSKNISQSILRLCEHGASSSIRAKALVALQLLFRHSPGILVGLAEKRLPSILAKFTDPIAVDGNTQSFTYRSAYSFLVHIRDDMVRACLYLQSYLKNQGLGASSGGLSTPISSPLKAGQKAWSDTLEPESMLSASKRTPASIVKHKNRTPDSGAVKRPTVSQVPEPKDSAAITSASRIAAFSVERIKIGASLIDQPALREIVIENSLISSTAELIHEFMVAQVPTTVFSPQDPKILSSIQSAISCLMESFVHINTDGTTDSIRVNILSVLIPAVCELGRHHDKDIRLLHLMALRKLAPSLFRLSVPYAASNDALNSLVDKLNDFFSNVPMLLRDEEPIPQYSIRIISEIVSICDSLSENFSSRFETSGLLRFLIATASGDDSIISREAKFSSSSAPDSQLIYLLRNMFEHSEQPLVYLRYYSSSSTSPSSPTLSPSQSNGQKQSMLALGITDHLPLAVTKRNIELMISLIGLLSSILHFVIRSFASSESRRSPGSEQIPIQFSPSEHTELRQYCSSLHLVTSSLIQVLSWQAHDMISAGNTSFSNTDGLETEASLLGSIQESCSRCIAILFDLNPVAVVTQIVGCGDLKEYSSDVSIINVLHNSSLDSKIHLRILKLILSISKLTSSFSSSRSSSRVKMFFKDERLHRILNDFSLSSPSIRSDIKEDVVEISSNILQSIKQMVI